MITQVNDIKRFFSRLGLKVQIHKPKRPSPAARHTFECLPSTKIEPDRMEPLLKFYFDDVRYEGYDTCSVKLEDFKEEGHADIGVCKRCGCSNNDACYDEETGSCWWVLEDVCSACATNSEKQHAIDEMKGLDKKGDLTCN